MDFMGRISSRLTMRDRDLVVSVFAGPLLALVGLALGPRITSTLEDGWPIAVLFVAAGWTAARGGLALPSRLLGTLGLAWSSVIASIALLTGIFNLFGYGPF
jgi:hypothetical protein